jgi:hypothetical protein
MMDRYDGDEIKLTFKERPGGLFIGYATEINSLLEKLKIDAISMDSLKKVWMLEEESRKSYIIPNEMRDAYLFAKRRLSFMKVNPQIFHQDDTSKRAELEKRKISLAKEIDRYEKEFARAEDKKRLSKDEDRNKINDELAVLNYKKKKYEDRKKNNKMSCLPICGNKTTKKLDAVIARIDTLQKEIAKLDKSSSESLFLQRKKLDELRKERNSIDKALSVYESAVISKARRFQNAMNNAEIVVKVRQLEIDEGAERYYGDTFLHVIHLFLKVYAQIKVAVEKANTTKGNKEVIDLLNKISILLDQVAEVIYSPGANNRTLVTLYRKMLLLPERDRQGIIEDKHVHNELPAVLVRTFSVKNFKAQLPSLSLFRKTLTEPKLAESGNAASENNTDASSADKVDQLKLLHQMGSNNPQ